MAKCYGLKKGENGTKNINVMIPTNGTPVIAVTGGSGMKATLFEY